MNSRMWLARSESFVTPTMNFGARKILVRSRVSTKLALGMLAPRPIYFILQVCILFKGSAGRAEAHSTEADYGMESASQRRLCRAAD